MWCEGNNISYKEIVIYVIDVGCLEIWLLGYTNQSRAFTPKSLGTLYLAWRKYIISNKVKLGYSKKGVNLRCVFSTSLSQKGSQMLDLAAISLSLWPENQQKPPKLFAPLFYERTTMEETGHLLVFLLFFFRPPLSKDVHWLKAKTRFSRNNKHWICLTRYQQMD